MMLMSAGLFVIDSMFLMLMSAGHFVMGSMFVMLIFLLAIAQAIYDSHSRQAFSSICLGLQPCMQIDAHFVMDCMMDFVLRKHIVHHLMQFCVVLIFSKPSIWSHVRLTIL